MSGFWQNIGNANNPNLSRLINQAIQGGGNRQLLPQQGLVACGNDINVARALLAASIPPSQPTFLQSQPPPRKTTSVISLPPSLAKRRKGTATDTSVANPRQTCVDKTYDGPPSLMDISLGPQGDQSTSSVAPKNPYVVNNMTGGSSTSNFIANPSPGLPVSSKVPSAEDGPGNSGCENVETPNPVFSTEISKGKPLPVSKVDEAKSIVLDHSQHLMMTYGAQRLLHDKDSWHKFVIIGGAKLEGEKVLKQILEVVEPSLLLPVLYQEEGEDSSFFARNCGSAIEKLSRIYRLSLQLDGTEFYIRIYLQCAPAHKYRVNALNLLRRVLEKRWRKDQRVLDLSDFQHDADLDHFMFCPLSQPTILHYVLHTAINHPINFSSLILSHNNIRQLKLDILVKASYFRSLDLSHNEILYQKDLHGLMELRSVTKLVLDGNPLCLEFKTPEAYVSSLKSLMPQLKSLDHVSLFSGQISVVKEQNFLCSKTGYHLVDQFLRHFFNRYDWSDRRCLDGLYHENALFSLTCLHISGQTTSETSKLTWYTSYNRNLMKLSDYSKADKLIYHGPSEILDLFCSLPASEHDPYSFCVDLIHFNDKAAVVSVAGVFREHPAMPPEPDYMRAFRRAFSLSCVSQNEWQITNEQLHITNPTSRQAETSFKIKRPPLEAPVAAWLVQDAEHLTEEEKDQMSNIMMQLTTLNKQWATRFLVESHWYVREALIAFVNQYEAKTLPEEAFASSCT